MTGLLVQRLSNVGVLQTSLTLHEPVPSEGVGSAYFNGSASMHVTSDLNDFAVGTGDFTVEWWQNMTVGTAHPRIWTINNWPNATLGVSIEGSGTLFYYWVAGSLVYGSAITSVVGDWHHFAVVRYFGTTTFYVDGANIGSINTGYNIATNAIPLYIGDEQAGGSPFNGYITNFQWCTGTALYTGPFTPPEVPTTAGANSKLLLLCGSAATLTTDSSGTNKTVVNGGATWSSSVPPVAAQPNGISNTYVYASTFDEVSLAPTILSTNLHAWFDAGNRASYPGSGVIWYDISGNGFSGIFTLIGPPGSPVPQGLFFNGVSSKIDLNVSNPTLPMTLSFWVKPNNAFQMWGIYDSAPGQTHVLRQTNESSPNNTAEWWNGDPVVSTGMVPGTWQYLTVVYHADTGFRSVETYVNGVPIDSGTGSPYIYYAWTSMVLGCINNSTNWYSGSMGQAQFYSRRMTQQEIAWNYSVDAVRYGLTPNVDIYGGTPPGPMVPQPVAQRQIDDGTLQVKTQFDEVTLDSITTQNLILELDAGDPLSYPGSGTTWTDLIGGKVFTLYNGVTYSGGNGGCLVFDHTSSQYADATSFASALTNWTVEVWVYYTGQYDAGSPCIITEAYAGTPINFTIGNTTDSAPNMVAGFYNGAWTATPNGFVLSPNQWYQLVGTWDGTNIRLYVNGVLATSNTSGGTAARGGVGIRLMRRWDAHQYQGGSLGIVRIYDADIGSAGVTGNFNADRQRFGL